MKKLTKALIFMSAAVAMTTALVACGDGETPAVSYSVIYAAGEGGVGEVPVETKKAIGEKFKLKSADGLTNTDGKVFDGWSDGSQKYMPNDEYTMPSKSVTFTAQWKTDGGEPQTYTVTYELNGGTGTAPTETAKQAAQKFNLAQATGISNGNKEFGGWKYNNTVYKAGAEFTMPSENVTFTAQWNDAQPTPPTLYKITYAAGEGATGTPPTEADKAEGTKFKLAQPAGLSKPKHTFAGWSDGTNTYQAGYEYTMPARAVTFTAQWKENEYAVTFRAGVGADGTVPVGGNFKENAEVPMPNPTSLSKDGYVFAGWKDDKTGTVYQAGDKFTMPAEAVSFTAQWKVDTSDVDPTKKFTVQVVKSGNESQIPSISGDIPEIADKAVGEKFTIPADTFTFAHYHIDKWRVQKFVVPTVGESYWETLNNYAPDGEIEMPEANIRIVAVWAANDVTISFDANGGSGTMSNVTKQYNSMLSLNTDMFACKFTAPAGKIFKGWATTSSGNVLTDGTKINDSIVSLDDKLTLYAIWVDGPLDIATIAGHWTNGTDTLDIVADNLGDEYVNGVGILNGQYLVKVALTTDGNAIWDMNGTRSVYYGLEYNGTDNSITLTPMEGAAITLTTKTALTDAETGEFNGKWAKTLSNGSEPWVVTAEKAYRGNSLAQVKVKIIGSHIAMFYGADGYGNYTYIYVLSKVNNKLMGYYHDGSAEDDTFTSTAVEFTAGDFHTVSVDGKLNQIVNAGGAPDTSKLPKPTAPDGQEFKGWVIKGTETPFDTTAVMTADIDIVPSFGTASSSNIKTYTGAATQDNGQTSKVVINFDTNEITFTYLGLFGKESTMVATATRNEKVFVLSSDNPTHTKMWIVVSEDGSTIEFHDNLGNDNDALLGTYTIQA